MSALGTRTGALLAAALLAFAGSAFVAAQPAGADDSTVALSVDPVGSWIDVADMRSPVAHATAFSCRPSVHSSTSKAPLQVAIADEFVDGPNLWMAATVEATGNEYGPPPKGAARNLTLCDQLAAAAGPTGPRTAPHFQLIQVTDVGSRFTLEGTIPGGDGVLLPLPSGQLMWAVRPAKADPAATPPSTLTAYLRDPVTGAWSLDPVPVHAVDPSGFFAGIPEAVQDQPWNGDGVLAQWAPDLENPRRPVLLTMTAGVFARRPIAIPDLAIANPHPGAPLHAGRAGCPSPRTLRVTRLADFGPASGSGIWAISDTRGSYRCAGKQVARPVRPLLLYSPDGQHWTKAAALPSDGQRFDTRLYAVDQGDPIIWQTGSARLLRLSGGRLERLGPLTFMP